MWSNAGGFMDGGSGAGVMNSPSQMGSPLVKKERRAQNVVPVTVRTINNTQGELFIIGDTEISMVVLVGIIRSVDVSSTKTTYVIEDTTGSIEGVQWENSDSEMEPESNTPLMENTYCRVVGSIRTQMGKKHIMIFNIVPITDLNRVTTHLLEVLHTTMKIEELQHTKMNDSSATTQQNSFNQQSNQAAPNAAVENSHGLQGHNKIVYQIIKTNNDETGINRDVIYDAMSTKMSRLDVNKALDDLSGEGLIFSTIDDFHYKTADSF